MSTNKRIDLICLIATLLALALTFGCVCIGLPNAQGISMGYEARLFDTSRVHTIDIVMNSWQSFIDTCENEEYSLCSVVIDGDSFKNIGIRGKGNTSLSSVSSMDSDRYSFKLEFDHYTPGGNYYGLDKLSLNNLIQDNTMMKDYLVYEMMRQFGSAAPLCSFTYITVNGEDFGLYLAVEGVEDSFLQRNYGSHHGELYKPDSMSFGGGRGNGKDFDMQDFMANFSEEDMQQMKQTFERGDMPQWTPQAGDSTAESAAPPEDFDPASMDLPEGFPDNMADLPQMPQGGKGMGGPGGMGSNDTKLQYSDDSFDSYSNIFNNAKTDVTDADKHRLIGALKTLSQSDTPQDAVNIEAVLRYFVVHNYVANGDSYTGSIIHNYYLYEENGKLSMLPWDYNLAFGTFQGRNGSNAVNDPIDTPMDTGSSDRPMIDWILESEQYLTLYHKYFSKFLETVDVQHIIQSAAALIDPYVEKDPTKFCTYEEFKNGVDALSLFCDLRSQSIRGQLDGTIPSTTEDQQSDPDALIDVADLNIADMGSMGSSMGGPGGDRGGFMQRPDRDQKDTAAAVDDFPKRTDAEGTLATQPVGQTDTPAMPEETRQQMNVPVMPDANQKSSSSSHSLITLGGCAVPFLFGFVFALCYKRKKTIKKDTA